ncbi:hypothetical protein ACFWPH_33520 [Nocardia sp. NPDC058499]|uniref:hypothetical protein n=1 Tax=Nocardia sp. NPDC058499 TaxID=3346530 RepID=UPI00364E1894
MATEIAIMKYRVKKADHDRAIEVSRDYLDYEYAHPETFHYTSTRFYFMDAPDNPDEEVWMFIDWFDDFDDYENSLHTAQKVDLIAQEKRRAFFSVVVPDSLTPRERWTEAERLRVDSDPECTCPKFEDLISVRGRVCVLGRKGRPKTSSRLTSCAPKSLRNGLVESCNRHVRGEYSPPLGPSTREYSPARQQVKPLRRPHEPRSWRRLGLCSAGMDQRRRCLTSTTVDAGVCVLHRNF